MTNHFNRPLLFALVFIGVSSVQADVTVKSINKSSGFKGFGAMEGSVEQSFQGVKLRQKNDLKFKSKLMQMMAGSTNGVHITRVDLDKIWMIDGKRKNYREVPIKINFEEMNKKNEAPGKPEESKPTHRLKKSEFKVKKTGEKKTINGYKTEKTVMTLTAEVEELATKEVTTTRMEMGLWLTPWTKELRQLMEEQLKFSKAFLAKSGFPAAMEKNMALDNNAIGQLLGIGSEKGSDVVGAIHKQMKAIDGFTVASSYEWNVTEDPKAVARKKEAMEKGPDNGTEMPDLASGPKNIAGSLIGGFAKKKFVDRQTKAAKAREALPTLSGFTEITSISFEKISPDLFDIPAGYKKVK